MPGYRGITLINIGTGPSNARNVTDHVAVLRPHAWLMLGHCAGLRNTQRLGDYVLAHGYVREDHVLDRELPLWVPIPALAEMQVALEQAVERRHRPRRFRAQAPDAHGHGRQRRQPQLGDLAGPRSFAACRNRAQSRSTWNRPRSPPTAYRFRVPYGTLLCVSDKPLHGEIKLAGMASEFYRQPRRPASRDRPEGAGAAQAAGIGAVAFAQAAQLCRSCVPVKDNRTVVRALTLPCAQRPGISLPKQGYQLVRGRLKLHRRWRCSRGQSGSSHWGHLRQPH